MDAEIAAAEGPGPGAALRALLTERHEAFVQEMWTLFERTVAQLEEEVRALRAHKDIFRPGPEGGGEDLSVEGIEPDAEEVPDCSCLETEGPDCFGLRPDAEAGLERGGLQINGPDSGGLQTDADAVEGPDSGGLQTDADAVEGPDSGGLQTDSIEGPDGGGLQTDAVEGPDGGGLLTDAVEGPDGGGLLTDAVEGPDGGGLLTDAVEGPDSGGLLTDAVEGPDGGGLQTDADAVEGPDGGGLQADAVEGPDGGGLQTDTSQTTGLRQWIMKRIMMMRPKIVLRRCDAKPAEDPNSAELTENSSDSDDEEEDFLRRKKTCKKSLPVSDESVRGSDFEAAHGGEIQLENLLLDVIVLTDSGDEEEDMKKTNPSALENLEIKLEPTKDLCCKKQENTNDRPERTKDYDCPVCGISLFSKSSLRIHKTAHLMGRTFECTDCGMMFKHKPSMRRHKEIHLRKPAFGGTSQTALPFQHEGPRSLRKGSFKLASCSVLKQAPRGENRCELCRETFPSDEELRKHVQCHKQTGKFCCFACPQNYKFYSELIRHLQAHRPRPKSTRTFCCSVCQKEFFSMSKYKAHCLLHKTKRTFSCADCGKHYSYSTGLYRHRRLHKHTKENKDSKHQVSGRVPSGKLCCSMCRKEFSLLANFYKHILLHETKTCLVCGKVFRTPYFVRRHMITHTLEKPFSCPVCDKRFSARINMANHMVSFHQR